MYFSDFKKSPAFPAPLGTLRDAHKLFLPIFSIKSGKNHNYRWTARGGWKPPFHWLRSKWVVAQSSSVVKLGEAEEIYGVFLAHKVEIVAVNVTWTVI